MSSNKIKGIAEIELKTDRFTQPADKAKRSLDTLGTQGKQSVEKIAQGADRAKQSMTAMASTSRTAMGQVGQAGTRAGQQVAVGASQGTTAMNQLGIAGTRAGTQISQGMVQAATATRQVTVASTQASVSMGVMTLGVAALGTSIGTTFTGMSNLNKAHLKQVKSIQKVEKVTVGLARANDLLSSTNLAVERFTLAIAKAQKDGTTDTDAYTIAVKNLALQQQKLNTANADYAVKLADIKIAQDDALQVADDLQDTYINMTISIGNTVLMSAFLIKTLVPNLSRAWIVNKVHILANTRAMLFFRGTILKSIFNLGMFRNSLVGATFGLRGLATGVKAFMLALGPLGIALIAIGTLWALWETNTFGVRDAIQDLWKWLKIIMPVLAALELLVRNVFPPAEAAIEGVGEAAEDTAEQIIIVGEAADEAGDMIQTGLIPDLDTLADGFEDVRKGAKSAGDEIDKFKKKRENLSRTVSAETSASFADILFGRTGIFSQTGRQLAGFIQTTVSRRGTEAARAEAQALFPDATKLEIDALVRGSITVFSRLLTRSRGPFGGGAITAPTRGGTSTFAGRTLTRAGGGRRGRNRNRDPSPASAAAFAATREPGVLDALMLTGLRLDAAQRLSGAAINASIRTTVIEALARVRLVPQLLALNPFANVNFQTAASILRAKIAAQEVMINQFIASTGLSREEVTQFKTTAQGDTDLSNISAFQDRLKLEANTV